MLQNLRVPANRFGLVRRMRGDVRQEKLAGLRDRCPGCRRRGRRLIPSFPICVFFFGYATLLASAGRECFTRRVACDLPPASCTFPPFHVVRAGPRIPFVTRAVSCERHETPRAILLDLLDDPDRLCSRHWADLQHESAGRMRRVHGVGRSLPNGVLPLHGVYRSPAKPTP